MSPREKKLLTLFAVAGFVVVNLVGLSLYNNKSADLAARKLKVDRNMADIMNFGAASDMRADEMEWLANHMPEPAEYENVLTALQSFCESEARRFNLGVPIEVNVRARQPAVQNGHFQRVKMTYRVSGMEADLYKWLDRINSPTQFRAATSLLLNPNKDEPHRIDCQVTVEQWFVPASPSA